MCIRDRNAAHPERRTADSFPNGKTTSPTKPHLQLATTRLRSYRQAERSSKQPLQAAKTAAQWQAESQAFDIIGGKLIPGWGGQPNRINTRNKPQKGVSYSKIWEQTSGNTKYKTTDKRLLISATIIGNISLKNHSLSSFKSYSFLTARKAYVVQGIILMFQGVAWLAMSSSRWETSLLFFVPDERHSTVISLILGSSD